MNATQDTASMICDKYALLRKRIQAMEIDAVNNHCFFFCLSASPPRFLLPAHTHTHSFPHSHTHIEIYTKSSWCHCSCPRSVLKCSHETGYWLKCDSRIREWTKSDTSQWTLDLHSHLCPLSSQSAFGSDVCSQLNRSHSTTAAAYLELVKGGSYPLS